MSNITTHVLDTSIGKPAAGIHVLLELKEEQWQQIGTGTTNDDGRIADLVTQRPVAGHYRISFALAAYFEAQKVDAFYPAAHIEFIVKDPDQHYHVPLLLNPFGYSTYRGS
jgi:5-hydroxyisourate hydrolase